MNDMQKLAFEIGRQIELEKLAKKDNRPEAGWGNRIQAAGRSTLVTNKKGKQEIDPKLIMDRKKKIRTHGLSGAGIGAAGGALVAGKGARGLGALYGAGVGFLTGSSMGQYKADKKFLGKKGIKHKNLGFDFELSNKAKKKYLHKDYKGGGYSPKK